MFNFWRNRRRRQLLAEPFPVHWEAILARNVGHYAHLTTPQKAKLRDILRIFIAEKKWEGSRGFVVTDEVRVTIAAYAALLVLGMEHEYFQTVDAIIVYPTTFASPNPEDWEDDEVTDPNLAGQAVYRGPVILSWDAVLAEGRDMTCGQNVVLHEFAHQLDFLDQAIDGTPPLDDPALAKRWAPVMQAAYDRHLQQLEASDEAPFFSEHAAENETEFFADATEAFFCSPHGLKEVEPEVYDLFLAYYRLKPHEWFPDVG
jgi:MtfA peptidase